MRSKLNYLIDVSLKRKIKTKWFVAANIILAILIIGLVNMDSIISSFGGDFDKKQKIYVIDKTDIAYDLFESQISVSANPLVDTTTTSSFDVKEIDKTEAEAKKIFDDEVDALILVFEKDEENILKVKLISKSYIDLIDSQLLANAINNTKVSIAIVESNIPIEKLNDIYSAVVIDREILDESKSTDDENMEMIMTTIFPMFILPFFMLTMFLVQMIGAEVNDEKTTRGMEIIISNVSPKTHFFSKIVAGNLFVLIQGTLLLCFSGIGLLVRNMIGGSSITNGVAAQVGDMFSKLLDSGFADKLIYVIPLTLILMILTFIAYSLLAGILASMTTNIEDFQQLQSPIIIISVVGYYLSMMAGMFKGAVIIKILSFVPFISAILSPSLLVLGQIGVIEVIISTLLMAGTIYLLVKYGLRIYKVGILNYSSSGLWKKMFKALKD